MSSTIIFGGETTEHRLPKKPHQEMSGVLTAPRLRQNLFAKLSQPKRIIAFPLREQAGIGRDVAAMEFQLQAAVEIDPKASLFTIHPSGTPSPSLQHRRPRCVKL